MRDVLDEVHAAISANSKFCGCTKQWLMAARARSQVLWGIHGSMRMRSGQTTAWQPYTCTGVCACAVSGQIVSLCFWSDYQQIIYLQNLFCVLLNEVVGLKVYVRNLSFETRCIPHC